MKTKRILALEARRDAIGAELGKLDDLVLERGADLDGDEKDSYDAFEAELATVAADLKRQYERESLVNESLAMGATVGAGRPAAKPGPAEDEPIYRADYAGDNDPLMDVWRAQTQNDPDAQTRIRRHNDLMVKTGVQILRASGRSDFGGLVVPEYAIADFAEIAREQRAFLNSLNSRPLTRSPVVVPLGSVGATMGTPSAENIAYSTANVASTALTLTARTVAGVAEVSVEAVEFGTLETPILFGDMISAYQERLDYQCLHGDGNNSTHLGLFATPSIQTLDGSGVSSFQETYAACLQAAAQVRTVDKRTATHVLMSSMRWYSLQAATDGYGRPLMADTTTFPQNVGGSVPGRVFAGLQVVVDDNIIATNGDDTNIVVYRAQELVLREQNGGNPATIRVDQAKAAQGTVQFIARGFSIFSAGRRPKSVCVIEDLPEPTFPLPPVDES